MFIQLAGGTFHEWHINTVSRGKRAIVAPYLDMPETPAFVQQYMDSAWRRDSMNLEEFFRKSNDT
eukprot:7370813-Karenia_brevis.AAC.1